MRSCHSATARPFRSTSSFPFCTARIGEDGTIQGLLELADLPYVGSGVLASSVGMDKALMKSVFRDAGIPVCRWIVVHPGTDSIERVTERVAAETRLSRVS